MNYFIFLIFPMEENDNQLIFMNINYYIILPIVYELITLFYFILGNRKKILFI